MAESLDGVRNWTKPKLPTAVRAADAITILVMVMCVLYQVPVLAENQTGIAVFAMSCSSALRECNKGLAAVRQQTGWLRCWRTGT